MEDLETLLNQERAKDRVLLVREEIPDNAKADALCARGTGMQNLTVIDERIDSQARVNELDAHELGHHRHTVFDLFPGARNLDLFSMNPALAAKLEALADREAASICISPERIIDAYIEGCRGSWEFAATLGITEITYIKWIDLQRGRYGSREFHHRDYVLTFEPLSIQLSA